MQQYDSWTISKEAKEVMHAIDDDSFLSLPDAKLQSMRRECRRSLFNNVNEQNGLNQSIAAISEELDSRNSRRTNRWFLILAVLTLLVAVVALIVPLYSK